MNIVKAKKNLLNHLHLLPDPVQADVKFLLEKFDATVRELKEIKRNAASWNKVENLPHEIWRDIAGYEGLYMVSNMGRVKSFIRQHYIKGDPEFGQVALARKFNVNVKVIYDVVHHKTYKDVE